ncbi:hypothetical protein [Flagellimonas sp.]|uniref:hypothetical protein n=1 Tax=Flagellimonas sp. TaxID=2058762 RepID=UPI003F49DEDF
MKRIASILLILYLVLSCKSTSLLSENVSVIEEKNIQKEPLFSITLKALNLSEDMSSLSTKNDEILLIIYDFTEKNELGKPILAEQLTFDQNNRLSKITARSNNSKSDEYLVFLIEQDSEISIERIDPTIRIHYKKIIELYDSKDYLELEKYIGDEDLLGVAITDNLIGKKTFDFQGFHKLDRYHYNVSIQK